MPSERVGPGCLLAVVSLFLGLPRLAEGQDVTRLASAPFSGSVDPSPPVASQQIVGPLEAESAVALALEGNRTLRAALRELGVAEGQVTQARLLPNPRLEGEWWGGGGGLREARVEFDLTDALLRPLGRQAASAELEARRREAAELAQGVAWEARVAVYGVQAAEARLAVAQQALDALAAGRDTASALFEAGGMNALDLASRRAVYERARLETTQAEVAVVVARERVNRLLGLHGEATRWEVSPLLGAPPRRPLPDDPEAAAVEASFALQARGLRVDGARLEATRARASGWAPDVSVAVVAEGEPGWSGYGTGVIALGGGFSAEIPLFDRQQGLARSLDAQAASEEERLYGLAVDVRSEVRGAVARLEASRAAVAHLDSVAVPAQRGVLEETLRQYNAMQVSVFDLLNARSAQLDLERARVDALEEAWIADATLATLLAGGRPPSGASSPGPVTRTTTGEPGGHR